MEKNHEMLEQKGRKKENEKVRGISVRGRIFQGTVVKKFEKRIVIEFERTIKVRKYERFAKKKTRLHARVPEGLSVNVGDYVKIGECRPLSKIINFVVVEVIKRENE
jgi:small subunit ribosomal protein S17